MTMQEFIEKKMQEVLATYNAKAEHYGKLDNFKKGGMVLFDRDDYVGMFEAAKAYQAKHIAYIYSHNPENASVEELNESLGDIINYCFIMMYFAKCNKERKDAALYRSWFVPPPSPFITDNISTTNENKGGN